METTNANLYKRRMVLAISVVALVLLADQLLKFWVKTSMTVGTLGEIKVMGDWFRLHFTENPGMAFGMELPGQWGKLALTSFRMVAVLGIVYYLVYQAKKSASASTMVLLALILGGALGNIIDSVFYGQWFTESIPGMLADWNPGDKGYAPYFQGKVVDMFYFPLFSGTYPSWLPVVGGKSFTFFSAIFNIADAAISVGLVSLLLFKRNLFQASE